MVGGREREMLVAVKRMLLRESRERKNSVLFLASLFLVVVEELLF